MDSPGKLSIRIRRLWSGSIRRRLILGISALLAIAMAVFVVDMSNRQADYLHRERQEEAKALAQTLAANSVSWALAGDLAGLQEVVQVLKGYPDVRYAMVLARDGKVLAHTDPRLPGRYARDPVSDLLLRAPLAPQFLVSTSSLVDVAAPIQANGALIGWARVSLDQDRVNADLRAIARNGIAYAAIAVVLGILLAVAVTRGLTRDLTRLVKAARRIGAGERGVHSGLAREDELGELSSAFDGMSSDLDRAGQALREREATIGSLVDKSPLAMLVASGPEQRVDRINDKFIELFGYTIEEMPDVAHWWPLAYPEEKYREEIKAKWFERVARAIEKKGEIKPMEATVRCKDGALRYVEFRLASIGARHLVTFVDLTERKRAEEALYEAQQVFRALIENSPDIIARYDRDCRRTYVNPTYLKVAQISEQKLLATAPVQRSPLPAASASALQDLLRKVLDSGVAEAIDVIWPKADNVDSWYNVYAFPEFDREGRVVSVMSISRDITERKHAEEMLQRLNRELRAISICNQVLVRAEDEQTLLNDICRIVCDEAGYRMAWVGIAEHDEAKTVRPVAWAGLESGYIANAKLTWAEDTERGHDPAGIAIRSGEIFHVQDFASDPQMAPWRESALQRGYRSAIALPLKDESASVFGVLLMYSAEINPFTPDEIRLLGELSGDLAFGIVGLRTRAERKRAEQALRDSEKDLKEAQRLAQIGSWDWDTATDTITWSEEYYRIYGVDPTQRPPGYEEHLKAYMPESAARLDAAVKRNTQTGEPYELELELARTQGQHRWITARSETKRDAQGRIIGLRGTAQDITERKRAEEEQRAAALYARSLIEANLDPLVTISAQGMITDANKATEDVTGFARDRLVGTDFADYFTEPDQARAGYQEVLARGHVRDYPLTIRHSSGRTTDVLYNATVYRNEAGELSGVFAAARDVTERKRAQEALRHSEASLKEAQRIAHVGNWELDLESNRLTWTEEIYRIFEIDPAKFGASYEAFVNAIHPDDRERVDRAYTDSVKNRTPYDIVHRLLMQDGRVKYVNERCETAYDPAGRPQRSIGTLQDVTARRQAEEALREREEFLNKVVENIPNMIFVKDAKALRFVRFNQAGEQLLGYPREDLLGKNDYDLFPKEEADFFTAKDREVLDKNRLIDIPEETVRTRVRGERILHTRKIPIVDDEGKPQYLLGISEDITERKQAEAVRTQLAAIVQSSHDAIIGKDLDGIITSWNPGAEKIYGYRAEEVVGKPVSLLAPESRKHEITDLLENVRRAEAVINFETVRIRKDGTCVDISLDLSPIKDAAGRIVGASTIARDITEKKQAERALRKVNRALKALSSCNEALIHATDEIHLLNEICRIIVDIEGYRLAWVGYVEHDAQQTIRPVAQSGYEPGYMEHADITWADNERGRGPLGIAIRTGQIQVVQDAESDPLFAPWRANAARLGYGSVLVAPLVADSRVIGALSIHAEGSDAFDEAEIALLRELAADMAFGIVTLRTRGAQEQSAERLQRSMEATVQVIASTVEMRDPYTAGHQRRVAELATAIAREMGLTEDQVHAVHLAGVVHDLGKIHIPAEILSKPGKLSSIEFELIKSHPEAGYDILKGVDFPWPIAQIVYQHHERSDGSGYPRGLKADEILLEARILMVADVVEAMSSHRPYRPSLGIEPALQEISANAGKFYDADVVRACLALFREKAFAFKA